MADTNTSKSNTPLIIGLVAMIVLVIGGVYYYFKTPAVSTAKKPATPTTSTSPLSAITGLITSLTGTQTPTSSLTSTATTLATSTASIASAASAASDNVPAAMGDDDDLMDGVLS